jgi:hypothetical protein
MTTYSYITNCPCDFCKAEMAREKADQEAAALAAAAKEEAPKPTSRLLTRDMVLKGSPCYEYRNRFTERYGQDGVMVTVEKALSESDDWDWEWAGAILLSRKAKAEFSRRSREAEKAYDDAMKPYWGLVNAAYDKYYEVRSQASREAFEKGLSYGARYEYMDKASEGIISVPNAAQNAAHQIAGKMRSDAWITAFAELFILDEEAYNEEHKNDEPVYDPDLEREDEDDDYLYNED